MIVQLAGGIGFLEYSFQMFNPRFRRQETRSRTSTLQRTYFLVQSLIRLGCSLYWLLSQKKSVFQYHYQPRTHKQHLTFNTALSTGYESSGNPTKVFAILLTGVFRAELSSSTAVLDGVHPMVHLASALPRIQLCRHPPRES